MQAKILLLAGLLLVLMAPEAHPSKDSDLLKGLTGLWVLVERVKPDLERDGVTKAQLTTRVQIKLRQAGIKVLDVDELEKMPIKEGLKIASAPALYLDVDSIKIKDSPLYAYSLSLEVLETVILKRDKKIEVLAGTWKQKAMGYCGVERLRSVYDGVDDMVNMFINDYLAANPK
jgi:hypothetical protein